MAKKKSKQVPDSTEYRKQFVKLLNEFNAYGYNRFNVWSDFLHVAAISLANVDIYHIITPKKIFDEREESYKRVIDKYKPACQELFPKMLVTLVNEMSTYKPGYLVDVLGELFHSMELHNEWAGQFFTPQTVADFMGMITVNDAAAIKAQLDERGYIVVNEPSCGGGANIIGVANGLSKIEVNPQKTLLTIANDIDERCVWMCFIQCSLYGLPAIIYQQNTLTQETFGSPWVTPAFLYDAWHIKARRFFKDEPQEVSTPPPIKSTPIEPPVEFGQLSLF